MSIEKTGEDHVDRLRAQWARELPDLDTSPMSILGRIYRLSMLVRPGIEETFAAFGLASDSHVERLRREFGSTKVLHVSNLPQHDLWRSGLLGNEVRRELAKRFPYVSGGWCCAPEDDKRRELPNSHSFHLNIPKPEDIRERGRLGSDVTTVVEHY